MSDELATQVSQEIERVETHFKILFDAVGSQMRLMTRMNEKSQAIRGNIRAFASTEKTSGTASSLEGFVGAMADLESSRQTLYDRVTHSVFDTLGGYAEKAKEAKGVCTQREKCHDLRNKKQVELNTLVAQQKSAPKQEKARNRLGQLRQEAEKADQEFYRMMIGFERQKVLDMKMMCQELCHAEIAYHAEALQSLTKAYRSFETLDEEEETGFWVDKIPSESRDAAVRDAPRALHEHGSRPHLDPRNFQTGRPHNHQGTRDDESVASFNDMDSVSGGSAVVQPATPSTPGRFRSLNPFKRNKNKGSASPSPTLVRSASSGGIQRTKPGESPHPGGTDEFARRARMVKSLGGDDFSRRSRSSRDRGNSFDGERSTGNYSDVDSEYRGMDDDSRGGGRRSGRSDRGGRQSERSEDEFDHGRERQRSRSRERSPPRAEYSPERRSRRSSSRDRKRSSGRRASSRERSSGHRSRSASRERPRKSGRRNVASSDPEDDGRIGLQLPSQSQQNLTSDVQSFEEFSDSYE
jgi:FAM92 protein